MLALPKTKQAQARRELDSITDFLIMVLAARASIESQLAVYYLSDFSHLAFIAQMAYFLDASIPPFCFDLQSQIVGCSQLGVAMWVYYQ